MAMQRQDRANRSGLRQFGRGGHRHDRSERMRRTQTLAATGLAVAAAVAAFIATAAAPASAAATLTTAQCAALDGAKLPETTIESATEVAGPSFTPPGGGALTNLPAFCRVVAV